MKCLTGVFVLFLTLTFGLFQFPTELQAAGGDSKEAAISQVSVNSADAEMLTQIPGIGPKTAEEIVKYRESNGKITSLDQLLNVKGIGEKKLAKLKKYLTL